MKRGRHIQFAILMLCLCFMALLALGIFTQYSSETNDVTANTVSDSLMFSTEEAILVPGMEADLPNEKEGTIVWWTKPAMSVFKEFKNTKRYLVMFVSDNVPGLMIAYNFKENNLNGGTPVMHTPKVVLFDNQPHQIGYTFKQGGLQSIYFDGTKLAESSFELNSLASVSGFMVRETIELPETIEGAIDRIDTFDKALTEEELKGLLE